MRKVEKNYCNKNYHPKGWKAWLAKYNKTNFIGCFCIYCKEDVTGIHISSGYPPRFSADRRLTLIKENMREKLWSRVLNNPFKYSLYLKYLLK